MKKEDHLYQIFSPEGDLLREETRSLRRQNRNQSKLKKFWQEHISTVPGIGSQDWSILLIFRLRNTPRSEYRAPTSGYQIKRGNRLLPRCLVSCERLGSLKLSALPLLLEYIIVYVGLLNSKVFTLRPKKLKGHSRTHGLEQNDGHHIFPTTGKTRPLPFH
jgi:hypothetical protein